MEINNKKYVCCSDRMLVVLNKCLIDSTINFVTPGNDFIFESAVFSFTESNRFGPDATVQSAV